ncbi:hypothetical protein VNI00_018253 [Paramarasmius palmivorus]|uniref:Uncharacterized protein n=1 Tax=Paramarasmius palmivorus TaxID=297713 RepID=A0AAW0B1S3_9AGAR
MDVTHTHYRTVDHDPETRMYQFYKDAREEMAGYADAIQALTTRVDDLADQVDTYSISCQSVKTKAEKIQKQINDLASDVAELKIALQEYEGHENKYSDLSDAIRDLNESQVEAANSFEEQIQRWQSKFEKDISAEKENQATAITKIQKDITGLSVLLHSKDLLSEEMQNRLEELAERIDVHEFVQERGEEVLNQLREQYVEIELNLATCVPAKSDRGNNTNTADGEHTRIRLATLGDELESQGHFPMPDPLERLEERIVILEGNSTQNSDSWTGVWRNLKELTGDIRKLEVDDHDLRERTLVLEQNISKEIAAWRIFRTSQQAINQKLVLGDFGIGQRSQHAPKSEGEKEVKDGSNKQSVDPVNSRNGSEDFLHGRGNLQLRQIQDELHAQRQDRLLQRDVLESVQESLDELRSMVRYILHSDSLYGSYKSVLLACYWRDTLKAQ